MIRNTQFKYLWLAALLLITLACQTATSLVFPPTATPLPTVTPTPLPTFTPTLPPTLTPTVIFEAACPGLLEEILTGISSEVQILSERTDTKFKEANSLPLITYKVRNDKIAAPHIEQVPEDWKDERDDRGTHEAIWNYFAGIIPHQARALVSEFSIFTDGRGNHLAAVSLSFPDTERWGLYVDILDAENYRDLTYTLIHEQGHLITLNSQQVPPSRAIIEFPENKTVYEQELEACPQYFTGEGCSNPDSYVNQFFDRFWSYLYEEWAEIDLEEDEDVRHARLKDFYEIYQDQFVTDYAPTSPIEDIAESWTYFVLSPKPELDSIAHEKILFFYEFPELVELRTQILKQVCVEFPK